MGGRGQYAAALIYRPVYISEPAGPLPGHHRLLQLRHMQDDADGLLAGGGKETAGVDDCHVRPGGVLLEDVPGGPAQLHHLFTVDHVFGAAQGNE